MFLREERAKYFCLRAAFFFLVGGGVVFWELQPVRIGTDWYSVSKFIRSDICGYIRTIPRYSAILSTRGSLRKKKTHYAVGYVDLPPQIAVNREWRYIGG